MTAVTADAPGRLYRPGMLFTEFLLKRLEKLERATHGYGPSISERALYATLTEQGMAVGEFLVLMEWGIIAGLLTETDTPQGRRFRINRKSMAALRARANGEHPSPAQHSLEQTGKHAPRDTDRKPADPDQR